MKNFLIAGVSCVALVFVIALLWLWDFRSSTLDAKDIKARAAGYHVEIIRDQWGVPHIFGKSDADTVFGLAYAHSEDDFETIQETVAATRGILARYRGVDAAPSDYIVSFLGVWETIESRYEKHVSDEIKTIATAYADGVNLYALKNPDKVWAGLAPFTPEDVIAGFTFKMPFFYGLGETLLALNSDDYQGQIAVDPAHRQQSWFYGPDLFSHKGSNAIALSPTRSADQKTRLIINSHQPFSGPVAWYEAHLVSERGMNITGGLFPGSPLILHGFNKNLGWAATVNKPDLTDIYRLQINPKNREQYKLDDKWVNFEKKFVTLRIGLIGPFAFKRRMPIYYSAHGPVIRAKHGDYALKFASYGEIKHLEQYYQLNRAQNLDEFINAMSINAIPSLNFVYADRGGNIGFFHNGQYPVRNEDWDWSGELPGDRSDLIWRDYYSFDQSPMLINPNSGAVFNANNTPYFATDGVDNLKMIDFPKSMGLQSNMTNRALRLGELFMGNQLISREKLLAIKFDNQYSEKSQTVELIDEVLSKDWSTDIEMGRAVEHLLEWDFTTNIKNRHAALGVLTVLPAITQEFTMVPAPTIEKNFENAVNLLLDNYGRLDVPWGEVNRLVRGSHDFPVSGGPDVLRAIYPEAIRDDGRLYANAGDSWIAVVEWNKDGTLSADLVHQYGSATIDENAPHYADQASLFVAQKFRKALIERSDIIATAEKIYLPLDE